MSDFQVAITDIIRAFNTGILQTREGKVITRTKPVNDILDKELRYSLKKISKEFENLRAVFQKALRDKNLVISNDGFYYFSSQRLAFQIDEHRREIIRNFNAILAKARLDPVDDLIQGY